MEALQKIADGKIDFQGQRLADRIAQETIAFFAFAGFVAGYFTESLQVTLGIYAIGFIIALFASVPPWPMYNKYPTVWLPNGTKSSSEVDSAKS